MKAARLHAIGDFRCDEVEVPVPHGKELLLKVGACGICGTDFPRVFEHGSSNGRYPLAIGHEFSGEVVAVGEEADPSLIGARGAVFPLIPCRKCDACVTGNYAMCEDYDYMGSRRDGGFAEYCLIPSEWHLIRSESASMESLAMAEPACVAQHAVRHANVTAGSYVVIFAAGPIGIMAARWVGIFGGKPLLVDIAPHKVEFARSLGLDVVNSLEVNVAEEVRKRNGGRLADAAIEGTGKGAALSGCIECVRPCGTISLLGNPTSETKLDAKVHSMILRKELMLHGIWNSSRAPYPVDEWAFTIRMMDAGKLVVEDLISDRIPLEELPEAMEDIRNGKRRIIKGMFA